MAKRQVTLTSRLAFAFVNAGWKLLSLLPLCVLYVIADCIVYPFVYHVARYRVRLVRANLAASFPQADEAWLRATERRFYHHFANLTMEVIRMRSMSLAEMHRRMVFENIDELKALADRSGMTFVHIGHYGNWEWVASLTSGLQPSHIGAQIYHPLENDLWNKAFLDVRAQYGGENIPMSLTLRRSIQLKRESAPVVIGFIADQSPLFEATRYFVPSFLNHRDTPVYTGAEQIGNKLGCAHAYLHIECPRRGYYRARFIPMAAKPQDGDMGVYGGEQYPITRLFFAHLEEQITAHPELWLWTHNRWKRDKAGWEERQRSLGRTV